MYAHSSVSWNLLDPFAIRHMMSHTYKEKQSVPGLLRDTPISCPHTQACAIRLKHLSFVIIIVYASTCYGVSRSYASSAMITSEMPAGRNAPLNQQLEQMTMLFRLRTSYISFPYAVVPRRAAPRPQNLLHQTWFALYSRGHGADDSSGFEHVFVGEIKSGEVTVGLSYFFV